MRVDACSSEPKNRLEDENVDAAILFPTSVTRAGRITRSVVAAVTVAVIAAEIAHERQRPPVSRTGSHGKYHARGDVRLLFQPRFDGTDLITTNR